jgi:general secretion pathway protein G
VTTRPHRSAPAFTLVEMLLVVILLGILATLVLPQFGAATSDSRSASLVSNLRVVRQQIEMYKADHGGHLAGTDLVAQLTLRPNPAGETHAVADPNFILGPYLQAFPKNSLSNLSTIRFESNAAALFSPPERDQGWYYNTATGEFRADLPNDRTLPSGLILNQF